MFNKPRQPALIAQHGLRLGMETYTRLADVTGQETQDDVFQPALQLRVRVSEEHMVAGAPCCSSAARASVISVCLMVSEAFACAL